MSKMDAKIYPAPDGGTYAKVGEWYIDSWIDYRTGKTRWQAKRPNGKSYSEWDLRAPTDEEISSVLAAYIVQPKLEAP